MIFAYFENFSHEAAGIILNSINTLDFVTDTQCVLCEAETWILYTICMNFLFQTVCKLQISGTSLVAMLGANT